jgi:hypothetical protein
MMKRLQAWALMILFLGVVGAGLYLWWRLDLRWRPHLIAKNQSEIAAVLAGSGWVSPGLAGPKLYVVVYRGCAACNRFEASQFPALQKAGVDTRVIMIARADLNGQPRSTAAERSTVAELWVNRSWGLLQRWNASPSTSWTAPGVAAADGDVARSAVVEAGRDMVDRLEPLLKANGVRFDEPVLVWWNKVGKMEGCACTAPPSWGPVRRDLGVN